MINLIERVRKLGRYRPHTPRYSGDEGVFSEPATFDDVAHISNMAGFVFLHKDSNGAFQGATVYSYMLVRNFVIEEEFKALKTINYNNKQLEIINLVARPNQDCVTVQLRDPMFLYTPVIEISYDDMEKYIDDSEKIANAVTNQTEEDL